MSILVIGVSHRSAPVDVLERLALDRDGARKLIESVYDSEHVNEVAVLATCNRIEVYADVDRFHGSVETISGLLCEQSGVPTEDVLSNLYVHYADGAVSHLFSVASGLDSMVVGEGQILGQAREALRVGQELSTVGPALNSLFQQAIRVGKRAHAETDIDHAAPSVVSAAFDQAQADFAGQRVLVVGAGSMASLAVRTAKDRGAEVLVANRTAENAERVAKLHEATALEMSTLPQELGRVDVLVSATGATGVVIAAEDIVQARADAGEASALRPLHLIDLALPHDIDPAAALLPGVSLVTLATLSERLSGTSGSEAIAGVREIVSEELTAYLAARRSASVTPTLVALRSMATDVVDNEVDRLVAKMPDLLPGERVEIANAMRRVAEKLLHQPTVRVKELADEQGAVSYAAALSELFALDLEAVEAVTRGGVQ